MNKKILIAGYEIGGQMQLLAETMRKRGIQATALSFNEDFRQYSTDIKIAPQGIKGVIKRCLFFFWALYHYQVFHFFWGISLLAIWRFHLIDLPILKLFRKKIIVHFRGTDLIDIKYYDYLIAKNKGLDISATPKSRPDQLKKLKTWLKYADHVLVSTPDLLFASPKAILSPQVINVSEWQPAAKPPEQLIKIAHAPSRRETKGTEFIIQAIEELKQEGFPLELILIENTPADQIKEIFKTCDLGIDQLLHGWYGKVSVELMALGKPVICYIEEAYQATFPDLPLINASPQTLKSVIKDCLVHRELWGEIGRNSTLYIKKHHDTEVIVDELMELLGFISQKKI